MKRILKYGLADKGECVVDIPDGGKILHVADQQGSLQLWCEVEDSAPKKPRLFTSIYTGFDEVPDGIYLGTVQSMGGNLVRHVYELGWG